MRFLYDPEDEPTQRDPYPAYRRLRDEHPVYHQERLRFWALSRFEDVLTALRDHDLFCSSQGLTWDPRSAEQAGILPMMVTTDPPAHTKLRKLINRGFTPKRVADLEPEVRAIVVAAIERLQRAGEGDLITDLGAPLPTAIIGRFLGVPPADRMQFHEWATAVVSATSGSEFHADAMQAAVGLYGYFRELTQRRRREPADDLIGTLIGSEVDGTSLTDEDVLGFCFNIITGGVETTTSLVANAMLMMQAEPAVRQRLAAEPACIPAAIEEFLRLETPVQGLCRTTTRDVTLHDVTIPAGAKVLLLFAAANRDEREFPEPDRLDVDRAPERHLAFGQGAHYCIGAALARLMGRVALEELTTRLGPHRIDESRAQRIRAGVVRGYRSLPIAVG